MAVRAEKDSTTAVSPSSTATDDEVRVVKRASRPGRPRSPETRDAILRTVIAMLEREDYGAISIERIAANARVSKHSIYRWWSSKGEVILDALAGYLLERAGRVEPSDDAFADLELFAIRCYRSWQDRLFHRGLSGLLAEILLDPDLPGKIRERILRPRQLLIESILRRGVERGQLRADLDISGLIDLVYGSLWFHLLFGIPGNDEAAAAKRLVSTLRPLLQRQP